MIVMWNSTLVVTPRGLTTTMIPTGDDAFQIDFDFVDHELVIVTSRGGRSTVPLRPMSVAHFYDQVLAAFAQLGVPDPGHRDDAPQAEFYSYAMPAPAGLADAAIQPESAQWVATRGEFILPYEAVRTAADPAAALLTFLQSTYDAAADLGGWDRPLLEARPPCDCVRVPTPSRADGRRV